MIRRAWRACTIGTLLVGIACRTLESNAEVATTTDAASPPAASPPPEAPAETATARPEPGTAVDADARSPTVASARAAEIERALARIDAATLRADVEALAADAMQGRATPSPGLDAAAAHIVERARALGLSSPPGVVDHRQTFACGGSARPDPAANVLAETRGSGPVTSRVIVSAHYDHLGAREGEGDGVWNGANDNASGVAAAIAIAGAAASLDPPPRRAVMLVAFCGEELGLRGSKHFVAEPPVPLASIAAAVNLEMLGRPSADAPTRAWVTGLPLSTMGDELSAINRASGVELVDGLVVGPEEGDAFHRSDNYPFARAGIVAHTVSTGRIDALYHSADDEPATLDYDAMVPIVRAIGRGVIALAEADDVPEWTPVGIAAGYGPPR